MRLGTLLLVEHSMMMMVVTSHVARLLFARVVIIKVEVPGVPGAGGRPLLLVLPSSPEAAAADNRHQQSRARAGHRRGRSNLERKKHDLLLDGAEMSLWNVIFYRR